MNERPAPNWLLGIVSGGLVLALVGGAILFAQVAAVAEKNSGLICAFGTAIAQTKVEQRAEENLKEFQQRVQATKEFAALLHDLQDCEPPIPVGVKIKPEDRQQLQKAEKAREEPNKPAGGDALQTPPASQPPSPSPPGDGPSPEPPTGNPPSPNPEPPSTPPSDGPVGSLLDDVCEVTGPLGVCLN